jgi:hypothetical protein
MDMVYYDYIFVCDEDLAEIIRDINDCQDKIIAVTQNGQCYTIFYERRGNKKMDGGC